MKKLSKSIFAICAITLAALALASCGKNYTYEKVVVNQTDQEITVYSGCCGNETNTVIPAGEKAVVFVCAYQSYRKPDCGDVSGKFSLVPSQGEAKKDISQAGNWYSEGEGKTVRCVFTLHEKDVTSEVK